MATPGRNDPCPCGSGRKYKHCCLDKDRVVDTARLRVRRAEGRIVEDVAAWAVERFGRQIVDHAWEEFFLWKPPLGDFDEVPEFETIFLPWFVTLFVADPHDDEREPDWPDEPLAAAWMRTERPVLNDLEREWIHAAIASPTSAFAVERVEKGQSLEIRDLLTGRRFHVLEQTASLSLSDGDLIFTRVVTAGGLSLMFGLAPFSFPPDFQLPIIQWRDAKPRRRGMLRADLADYDIEVRELYLAFAERARNPQPPVLTNTDGDPFELTTLMYDLSCPPSQAFAALLPLATIRRDQHVDEVVRDEAGAIARAVLNWVKGGNKKIKEWDNTILGRLQITAGELVAEVNSAKRANRIAAEIAKRLGDAATLRSRRAVDQQEMLASARRGDGDLDEAEPPDERTPEMQALEDEFYVRHLESWVDTPVPALGDRTPRQASRSASGREQLEALLVSFARHEGTGNAVRRQALANLRRRLRLRPTGPAGEG